MYFEFRFSLVLGLRLVLVLGVGLGLVFSVHLGFRVRFWLGPSTRLDRFLCGTITVDNLLSLHSYSIVELVYSSGAKCYWFYSYFVSRRRADLPK